MNPDNLVKVCLFYPWSLSGCGLTRGITTGTSWDLNRSLWFLSSVTFFTTRKWEVEERKWSVGAPDPTDTNSNPCPKSNLSFIHSYHKVFQKHSCRETGLDTVSRCLSDGAWVKWCWACLHRGQEVNQGRQSWNVPPNNHNCTVCGAAFKCGLEAKTKKRWEGGICMVLGQWLKVIDPTWSYILNGGQSGRGSLITVKNPLLHYGPSAGSTHP